MAIDENDMIASRVLPNGVAVVALVNANVVHNMRRDGASSVALPSTWRLAKCVVTEAAPLLIYAYPLR